MLESNFRSQNHNSADFANISEKGKCEPRAVRAAIYARISSPNQKFNYSIHEQIAQCQKHVKERGWITKYVFFDEESGRTIIRPKFQLMLEKARSGFFDVIVFWKVDRFCRSLVDLVNVERALREYGVGLSSVTEYVDTITSVGRFNFRSIGSVAELERELIGERARLGLHALAKEDKWPNPRPPLGYDKKQDGKLAVNQEVKLVQEIFEMYLKTPALPQVAFDLNERGTQTKLHKKWNATAVRNILTNEIYVGRYSVAGVSHYVEDYRIVPDDLFHQVQVILLRYKAGNARRSPMPETRRNAMIDNIFNQFLAYLNPIVDGLCEGLDYREKMLTSEKELFRLLNNGWNLVKAVGNEFTIRKSIRKPRLG